MGNCNGVRTNGTEALGRWMETVPTGISTPYVILVGDFNAYRQETPITTLVDGTSTGYVDPIDLKVAASQRYTYTFDGQQGTLDYALVSAAVAPLVTGAGIWHINADESRLLDYNIE